MESKAVSSTIANFAAKFINELQKDKNVVSSPLSVEFVLALLTLGSEEPARSQLLKALGMPDDKAIRDTFTTVSSKLKSIKGVTLNVANRVYLKDGAYRLEPKLEQDAVKVFNAGIEKMNFVDCNNAAQKINQWVENQTNHKIKDLLTPDSFNEFTRLVLINALYFKGSWKKKFNVAGTKDCPFHVNAATTIQVPMMRQEDKFKFGISDALGATLLEMPYEGEESSMLIVLPDEIEGLNGVMQKLAAGHDLTAELENMRTTTVNVTVPKFKIETEIDLMTVLPKLGVQSIFEEGKSGLNNLITPPESLFVSKAIQKAFIEVNEEGAEAAAATAMFAMATCAMVQFDPPERFVVDRPFLAAILVQNDPAFVATCRLPELN